MKLDVETDTCVVFGKKLNLVVSNSGHYCLPLTDQSEFVDVNWVLSVQLSQLSEEEQYKSLVKCTNSLVMSRKTSSLCHFVLERRECILRWSGGTLGENYQRM